MALSHDLHVDELQRVDVEVVRERHERLHRGVEAADRPARSRDAGGLRIRHRLEERAPELGLRVRTSSRRMADPQVPAGVTAALAPVRGFHVHDAVCSPRSHDLHVDELLERVHVEVVRERHERLHRGVEAADRPARGSRDAGGLRIRHRLEERAHARRRPGARSSRRWRIRRPPASRLPRAGRSAASTPRWSRSRSSSTWRSCESAMSDSIVAWKPRIARHEAAVTPAASGSAIAWKSVRPVASACARSSRRWRIRRRPGTPPSAPVIRGFHAHHGVAHGALARPPRGRARGARPRGGRARAP